MTIKKQGLQRLMLPHRLFSFGKRPKVSDHLQDERARRIKEGVNQLNACRQMKDYEALMKLDRELQPLVAQLYGWSEENTAKISAWFETRVKSTAKSRHSRK